MKTWKAVFVLLVASAFLFPNILDAHSGRTDSSGGHNCNVGACAGTYHYHNGGYAPAPVYVAPTVKPTIKPTVAPTVKPTPKPTIKSTLRPTPTIVPTTSPVIKGTSTETPSSSPPVVEEASDELVSVISSLAGGAVLLGGGYAGLKWLARVTAPKEPKVEDDQQDKKD